MIMHTFQKMSRSIFGLKRLRKNYLAPPYDSWTGSLQIHK